MQKKLLENFTQSLGYLGEDATNLNYTSDEKIIFKFEVERIDKLWRCFYAFYKSGNNNALALVTHICVKETK